MSWERTPEGYLLFPGPLLPIGTEHAANFTIGTRISGLAPVATQSQEYRTTLLRAKLLEVLVDLGNGVRISLP